MASRNQSLDVLRGMAILLVLGDHLEYYQIWARAGWIGVDLFFILSGFLISGLLFTELRQSGDLNVERFFIRRGFKIWPAFYVFTCVLGIAGVYGSTRLSSFFMAQLESFSILCRNYEAGPSVTVHVWSLAVEEHFYILLPLLLHRIYKWRGDLRLIPWICLAFAPLCLWLRILAGLPVGAVFGYTHLRIDGLFLGVLLGYLYHFHKPIFSKLSASPWLILSAVCIAPAFFVEGRSYFMQGIGITLLAVGFWFVVAWSVPRKPPKALLGLAWIGQYSYSIYVWHMPIAVWLRGHSSAMQFWMALFLCLTAGIIGAKLIEFPILKLRDRFFPSQGARAIVRTSYVGNSRPLLSPSS